MFGGLGYGEILLIFLIVLLLFGARRIPEIAQGLGKGIREFRRALHEVKDEIESSGEEDEEEERKKLAG
ncbi:MAG: twin-arginine translocase TatA/TatE family subunit [Candidatus Latescibacterota bacterium]|nr:MAG: twin-arginine translocase TatA/TatE family subunit [Candidatus Latescibacterota bacterium]